MFQKYKEIVYGIIFGIGAACLDTLMDSRISGNSFWAEFSLHPTMLLYRGVFVLLGIVIGWLVWKNNIGARKFRRLEEAASRFHQDCARYTLLIQTKLQVLLTRDDLHLHPEARQLVETSYQGCQELQSEIKNGLPL